ncbi:hypothetical protein [Acinetobacter gyllenbergii]|uniref:hypothetical protein n=1 Tax=Acinetobacter gyllenbergii TaxID=134534 RepID=UPI000806C409|nr:hypothetical protein [Acinetobacter gyllenbergii]OBY74301.1 hypothetical protein NG55_10760 [Acinetobacter gyllenbergii]
MKLKIFSLIFMCFSYITIGHAKTNNYLIGNNIIPKHNLQLSGSYPSINGSQFKEINNSIFKFITTNFDREDEGYPTEISFEKLFQSEEILSFSINYNISNSTERYFNKYYTLSLSNKKELSLSEYLKDKKISKYDVLKSINNFISPCLSIKEPPLDYCSDMTLQSLIENNTKVTYSDISSFFIKDNSDIGIGIDSNKFTTTFIYNVKSKRIVLN